MNGTPGFVGARLREAREARGLTAISLAEILSVSRSAVSLYELGEATPQPEVMRKIVGVLNLPDAFFLLAADDTLAAETIFYRSMSSATKGARLRGERRYGWLKKVVDRLSSGTGISSKNIFNPDIAIAHFGVGKNMGLSTLNSPAKHNWLRKPQRLLIAKKTGHTENLILAPTNWPTICRPAESNLRIL